MFSECVAALGAARLVQAVSLPLGRSQFVQAVSLPRGRSLSEAGRVVASWPQPVCAGCVDAFGRSHLCKLCRCL